MGVDSFCTDCPLKVIKLLEVHNRLTESIKRPRVLSGDSCELTQATSEGPQEHTSGPKASWFQKLSSLDRSAASYLEHIDEVDIDLLSKELDRMQL